MQILHVGDIYKLNKDISPRDKSNRKEVTKNEPLHPMVTYPNAHYRDLTIQALHFGSDKIKQTKRKDGLTALDFPTVAAYKGFKLDKYQKTAVDSLKSGNDVLVSAPTGTGKTLIAEEIILYNLRHGKQTFYTAPLKALVDDKFESFKKEFGEDRVARLTGDYKTENALKYPVVVMTTEVYRNMVLAQAAKNAKLNPATAIFDEIHSMGDLERGTVWEESIMASPKSTQIAGLSATVSNANKISKWIERIHTPKGKRAILVSVPTEQRHVPLHYYAYNPNLPGKLFDMEQEGISHDIFADSTVTNEKLTPRQIGAIEELNEIYASNPVIRGRRVLNRIRSKDCPKTEEQFGKILTDIAQKANVSLSPEETKFITNTLVANSKSTDAIIKANIRNFKLIEFNDTRELSPEQIKALEDLGILVERLDEKGKFRKKIMPSAALFLKNTEGVNDSKYNFDDVVMNIKKELNQLNIPNSDELAGSISEGFKVKKPNALINFINTISIKKEGIFYEDNAEDIIQKRLSDTLKKQGYSQAKAEAKANEYTERIRKAFCSAYDDPQIDTISKAVGHSKSQYVTKHLIKIPNNKHFSAKEIEEIKKMFTPEQINHLSLFGLISNIKSVNGIKSIQDFAKKAKSDENFLRGINLISSYSTQKIKTKEDFIDEVISSKFSRFKFRMNKQIKENLSVERRSIEIEKQLELQRYMDEELSDKNVFEKSKIIMDSMLEKQPNKVISTREILNKLIESEQVKENLDTSPERYMFRLPRKRGGNSAQLKQLGESLVGKGTDRGIFVLKKLHKTTKFPTPEHLKRAVTKEIRNSFIDDADEKAENIIKQLTVLLTKEEMEAVKTEILTKKVQGKISLRVSDVEKTTDEQAKALQKLSLLYEHLDKEKPFKAKSPNNGIINLMTFTTTGKETKVFQDDLLAILKGIHEPKAELKASSITQRLKSKIPNKGLEATFNSLQSGAGRNTDYMPDLINTLRKNKILPGLFFIFSRRRCGETLKECTQDASVDLLTSEEKVKVNEIIEKYLKSGELLDTKFEPTKKLLLRGYAVHHAGKMPAYKSLVQELSTQGLVKATFATETLAAGINYPTKTTIITSLNKPEGTSSGGIHSRALKASELQQMSGRAGRRGFDIKGNSVVVVNNILELQSAVDLAERMPEPVESHYRPSYGLVANLLMSNPSIHNLDEHFARSFLVEESGNPAEKDKIIKQLTSRTNDIVSIMMDRGYLEKKDGFGNFRVTAKGQIASMVKGVNELFLTELITNPKLMDVENIDSSMFAGIVSSVTYDSSNIHQKLKLGSTKPVIDEYNAAPPIMRAALDKGLTGKLTEIVKKEREIEDKNPLLRESSSISLKRRFISFNKWMSPFVYKWARYPKANDMTEFWEELTGVMKNGQLLKDSADFTRTISNTTDVLAQIQNIIGYIDDNDLYKELNADPLMLDRMKGLAKKAHKEISKIRLH